MANTLEQQQEPDAAEKNGSQKALDSTVKPDSSSRNRRKILTIILGVFLLLGMIGTVWWLLASGYEETDNATLEGHVHPVSAKVSGTITRVLVEDNQYVKAGQLLAIIDPIEYEVALKEAEANLQAAQIQVEIAAKNIPFTQRQASSQLLQAQGGIAASNAQILQTQASVAEAQAAVGTAKQRAAQESANYQKALSDYQRYQGVDPDAISAQRFDEVRTGLQIAEATRQSALAGIQEAQARLKQAQANVGNSRSRLTESRGNYQGAQAQQLQIDVAKGNYKSAQANQQKAQAALERAKLNVSYAKLYAPVSGKIGQKSLELGQRVQANEPLMALVQSNVWVIANFKETQLSRMKIGQPVEVDVDAFAGHHFEGRIVSFSPATGAQFALLPAENATGNFTKIVQRIPVKIMLNAKSTEKYADRLSPGMSVVVKVNTRTDQTGAE